MRSQFIEQVQILMEIQQIIQTEQMFGRMGRSNYAWLCTKKVARIWMSTKDEYKMRQVLTKVQPDQQVQIMKQLLEWLDSYPEADVLKIPEMALNLLNNCINKNLIEESNLSRMSSFRNSFKRLSMRIGKLNHSLLVTNLTDSNKTSRSVTFNDEPVVYRIFE